MRLVVQRVIKSSVTVNGEVVGAIGKGFNILVGVSVNDTEKDADYLAEKAFGLRLFDDKDGKTNLSMSDFSKENNVKMGILAISQFTIMGDVKKGKRPNFTEAAGPDKAKALYEYFVEKLKEHAIPDGISVETGIFRADMTVEIINDGPFTILLDSEKKF